MCLITCLSFANARMSANQVISITTFAPPLKACVKANSTSAVEVMTNLVNKNGSDPLFVHCLFGPIPPSQN